MGRENKNIYCFIRDENNLFCRAVQSFDGTYTISKSAQPYPVEHTPSNLVKTNIEFATNIKYNSLVRSISYPLDFTKDAAAILRHLYYNGKGSQQNAYFTIIQWNGDTGIYELSYDGKFDFKEKDEDPKSGRFTCITVDDSAWGVLSQNDEVEYAVDCSPTNPKAIPVLFDGINLENKYTYQTVQAPITKSGTPNAFLIPFVLINQNGDSAGIITKSQSSYSTSTIVADAPTLPGWFLSTFYALPNVHIFGDFTFEWSNNVGNISSGGIIIYFYTSLGQQVTVFSKPGVNQLVSGKIYTFSFDFNIDLAVGENVFFVININDNAARLMTITPIVTNVFIKTVTRSQPVIRYGLRPLDLLNEIVSKATNGRYNIQSSFFVENNKSILFGGDAIRGEANAHIYTTFSDFFKHFNCMKFMALRSIKGQLAMERYIEVYKNSGNIIDLGEIIDLKLQNAKDQLFNEVEVGCKDQDFRHPSGRLEFNSLNKFSLNILGVGKKLDLVTPYRTGCYDIQFLIMDYQGNSTQDNSGDKSVYVAEITDELGSSTNDVETFENIDIDNAILEPIIKSPLNNSTVTNDKPYLKGIAPPIETVNIYIDGVLDGSTVSDADGNWSYQVITALSEYIFGVQTGEHLIEVSFGTLADPISSITLVVDTSFVPDTNITYPQTGAGLYNNKPLIKGVAEHGSNVDVFIDGVLAGTVIADNSDLWEFQSPLLTNGSHIIQAGTDTSIIQVNSFVTHPLITYIGSELDGFVVLNNLPLIKGVAIPGTAVNIYLNYIQYIPLGTAVADANGNWEFQVVPVSYIDPVSGIPVIVAPIQNGLNIFSTSLQNYTVPITVSGYKLSRPAYSSITGVFDNSVFNTEYTPHRMMLAHSPQFAAILDKQQNESVYFQKPSKNGSLKTILDGITIQENSDIPATDFGIPLSILEVAEIKTRTYNTFSKTLEDFKNGGIVTGIYRGKSLFFMPIGGMKMNNITDENQDWRLQFSKQTTYSDLLNLYKNGTTISIMKNSIYHSNYNTLHAVAYDYQVNPLYSFKTIYQDWFENRNDAWLLNPEYIQKVNRIDPIKDQIISNGVSGIYLDLYRCKDAVRIAHVLYEPVTPAPISGPEVVFEASLDMTAYPEDQYFCVMSVGDLNVSIFERFETKDKWDKTLLIEASNSTNKPGFFFSTGIKTVIRTEGIIKKLQPVVNSDITKEESGDTELLYSLISRKNTIRFGTAYGLPDYLYLKIADAIGLDNFMCEGIKHTLGEGDTINPSEDVEGHPLYYYNVNMTPAINNTGATLIGSDSGSELNGVILMIDASAFGQPAGTLIQIEVDNE